MSEATSALKGMSATVSEKSSQGYKYLVILLLNIFVLGVGWVMPFSPKHLWLTALPCLALLVYQALTLILGKPIKNKGNGFFLRE